MNDAAEGPEVTEIAHTREALQAADRILVVIPTYDERENIPRVVPAALEVDPRIDILVVDDNSPDGTAELVREMQADEPRIHLLSRAGKQGLGRAYIAGFGWGLEAGYGRICEMDADLSHRPEDLARLIAATEPGEPVDLAIGSRYVGGTVNVVNWPLNRLFISLFGSWYARMITRLPVRDATGGFNLFRADALRSIDFDRIESNGYSFQIELKLRVWRNGFEIREIPIIFVERETGESKMSKKIVREAVWKVWKLRLLDLFGRL